MNDPPTTHSRCILLASAAITALTLLSNPAAMAESRYVKNAEPVFPAVEDGHALVYLARPLWEHLIPLPTFEVFVDGAPVGWLPQRSYLVAQVDPGNRLIWGPKSSERRFDFQAGKTYLLVLAETYGQNRSLEGTSWVERDSGEVQGLVVEGKLTFVTPTAEGLAELRQKGSKRYSEANRQAAQAPTLPATFETVCYQAGTKNLALKWMVNACGTTGTLTVSANAIEFKSDKQTLVVPAKDIRSVALDGLGVSPFLGGDRSQWAIVRFGAAGAEEFALFQFGVRIGDLFGRNKESRNNETIYLAVRTAAQSAASPPPAALPEGFVLFEGQKEYFTIAIPRDWAVNDQAQAGRKMGLPPSGFFALIQFYLSSGSVPEDSTQNVELMAKIDTGAIPAFFVQKLPAEAGMSCAGFSGNAEKLVLELIARDESLGKGATIVEALHSETAPVAGCRGLRIRGAGQARNGHSVEMHDVFAASDEKVLYLFVLRNPRDNFDKNVELFQKIVATARLTAAK